MIVKIFLVLFLAAALLSMTFYSSITGDTIKEEAFTIQEEGTNDVKNNVRSYDNFKVSLGPKKLENYKKMELKVVPGKVMLSDECLTFSVATTLDKTEGLIRSIEGTYGIRPDEHDILEEVIDVFDINLDYVAIDDIKDEIFYSHAVFYDDRTILNMDIKPSDGLAVAARFDRPIYVSKKLLEKYAESKC